MRKIYLLVLLFIFVQSQLFAQELRCNISISATKIQGANRTMFETMQSDLYEFMNNRKWTDEKYSMDERIECSFFY